MDPHDFAAYFDNGELSDVPIGLGSKRKRSSADCSIRCHKFLLGAESPVLKQRLINWAQELTGGAEEQEDLVIQAVSVEDAQAVEDLLRSFYTRRLPEGASPAHILKLMEISNKYQSAKCTEACARHLEGLDDGSFSTDLLLAVFQLPPFLMEQAPEFRGLVERADSKLKAMFLDLEAAWQKEELRELFLKLPAAAVKALLQLDTLAVVSENTVLLALICWLQAQPQEVPADLRADLVALIRLQHASPAYWAYVLPHFPCVAECVPQEHMIAARAFAHYSAAEQLAMRSGSSGIPDGSPLRAPPRSGTTTAVRSCRLTARLAQLQRQQQELQSLHVLEQPLPALHHNGFELSPYLLHAACDSGHVDLGAFVKVGIFSCKVPPLQQLLSATFRAVKVAPYRTTPYCSTLMVAHFLGRDGKGFSDYFGLQKDPPNTLASFAQDGQVTVEFEVHSCR